MSGSGGRRGPCSSWYPQRKRQHRGLPRDESHHQRRRNVSDSLGDRTMDAKPTSQASHMFGFHNSPTQNQGDHNWPTTAFRNREKAKGRAQGHHPHHESRLSLGQGPHQHRRQRTGRQEGRGGALGRRAQTLRPDHHPRGRHHGEQDTQEGLALSRRVRQHQLLEPRGQIRLHMDENKPRPTKRMVTQTRKSGHHPQNGHHLTFSCPNWQTTRQELLGDANSWTDLDSAIIWHKGQGEEDTFDGVEAWFEEIFWRMI